MGFELVGQVWSPEAFAGYVRTLDLSWASGVTMHHTAAPSLDARPHGFTAQHMENLRHYYRNQLGWSSGPHLFIDDDQIWGMSSLERRGVHARSFNPDHIGVEVLGNYDFEDPARGRGHDCWMTAALAVRAILDATGLSAARINAHRDDPRTSKSCPGDQVDMDAFRERVRNMPDAEDRQSDPDDQIFAKAGEIDAIVRAIEWQLEKLRAL